MLKHPVNHVIEAARHLVCCINKFSATFTKTEKIDLEGLIFLVLRGSDVARNHAGAPNARFPQETTAHCLCPAWLTNK